MAKASRKIANRKGHVEAVFNFSEIMQKVYGEGRRPVAVPFLNRPRSHPGSAKAPARIASFFLEDAFLIDGAPERSVRNSLIH
jgi:hypothetical protein